MKALPVILGHEFLDDAAEMTFAEKDEVIQALVSDHFHKALRVRIAIRTLCRNLRALHASVLEDALERFREKWIPR